MTGGDSRILLDPMSGLSTYGCRPRPDPDLVALGSSTASTISEAGFAAAESLRRSCAEKLRLTSPYRVYAEETTRLRGELLDACGFSNSDEVDAVLAASGTDLHLLSAQWLKPDLTVTIIPSETGSGVCAALQGQHFNRHAAYGGKVPVGDSLNASLTELVTLSPRHPDGGIRDAAEVDAECSAHVAEAASQGRRVLLVLTDVSKTGLIVPSVARVRELKACWPEQVEVLVDACQFRLATETVRAYVTLGWMVALTGSKFLAGPTFSGVLLVPPSISTRYRNEIFHRSVGSYSSAADWPADWAVAGSLPKAANFGLLLRWEAALTELRAFSGLPGACIVDFLREFARAVRRYLAANDGFREVSLPAISRPWGVSEMRWDREQTIFPFLLHDPHQQPERPLGRDETRSLYRALLNPGAESSGRRFQFGQPVDCGQRNGVAVSALRLCVSAPMVVSACRDGKKKEVIGDALAGLDAIAHRLRNR